MEEINSVFEDRLPPDRGFETYPFKVSHYNEKVSYGFRLPYDEEALCYVLISLPSMFEETFLPFLRSHPQLLHSSRSDLLDECMRSTVGSLKKDLPSPCDFFHDFDLSPNRRPKVLVQTAGHVSGRVRFYRSQDAFPEDVSSSRLSLYPLCLHPNYGGWFALRGVFIFPGVRVPELRVPEPPRILEKRSQIQEVLLLYNECWKNFAYRDVIPVKDKYSALQRKYFLTPPDERKCLLRRVLPLI